MVPGYSVGRLRSASVNSEADGSVEDLFAGSSPVSRWGINVPLIYTKAYACYGLKCVVEPDIPTNSASLALFMADAARELGQLANRHVPMVAALNAVRKIAG